ncbi:bacillithiol biosynthesis deacetylase BshB1 [Portibacter lacus]|uniref:Bacillithiol biosynthesis deacetylase BshB1 n=1 Tax=Portibacter lacus TaxID=1099794 RepID=A0AA37SMK3_9BACT|nr:bacillithiol biosynthesis deacetylase BshB1 [Portibacter lacus]GLR15714.1 bacillithiol biosynthesis deacetylase BshB1 [Portibacter lacus]
MTVDILAIGVHPDDVELSCSGTLLEQIENGYSVGLVDLTQGELGTRGSAEIRLQEALDASKILGAEFRENLGMRDGLFEINEENLLKLVVSIRAHRPKIVLANAIRDRHPDHGRAAELIHQACFLAGLRKIETSKDGVQQEAWRPKNVFHYIQDRALEPDFVFDISNVIEQKMEVIKAFKSQFYDPNSKEPPSPISGSDFMEFILAKARNFGREAGFEYAEGFTTYKKIGVQDLFDIR